MIENLEYKGLRWELITNPVENDYDYLIEKYDFHPLAIEDCHATANQRAKIDDYDDYYFLIFQFPYFDKGSKELRIRELKIFWGKNFIITIGKSHWAVKKLFEDLQEDIAKGADDLDEVVSSSDLLLYNILDRLMSESKTLIAKVGSELEMINYDIFNKRARAIIELISVTRKNIILLNTTFKPQLRVLHMFESGGVKGFVDPEEMDMEDYWGDILDQYQKMYDSVEDYGELVEGLSKTFDSLQANKTNEIMKVLTYFNTIMLPLTVITGLFGMNVLFPFETGATTVAFWTIVSVMVAVTIAMIIYFRNRTNR
ncbi:MAG: magnesium transporter CorA family protein [Bacteroidales bacterium]|nr:magnesium transporter CorA family protein [Bacteroidales bacterium]